MRPKGKWALFFCALLAAAALTGFGVYRMASGTRPFAHVRAQDIAQAQVELSPPGRRAVLPREDMEELAGILRVATVYQRDDSYRDYCGQTAVYTLTFTDGAQTTIAACNPFLVLDGVGFRTSFEPCQALQALAGEQVEKAYRTTKDP